MTWLGAVVVVAILAATALATAAAVHHRADRRDDRRAELAGPAIRGVVAHVNAVIASLDDMRGFFEASDDVTPADFRRFAAGPLARDPALAGLAWTPVGAGEGRALTAGAAGAAPDPRTLPGAAAAVAGARDGATTRITPPLRGAGDRPAVLVVSAVYRAGAPLATVAERRAALRGYVSGEWRLDAVAAAAGAGLPAGVRLTLRDGDAAVIGPGDPGTREGTVSAGGRTWRAGIAGVPAGSLLLPVAIAVGGVVLACVVALLFAESVSQEERARRELERLRVRHDLVLESAGDGIVGFGRDGLSTVANAAAARMLGRPVADLTRAPAEDVLPAEVAALVRAGRREAGESRMTRAGGDPFPVEYAVTPIAEDGVPMGAVVTFRDVTARKRLEARTLESLAAAEELAAIDPLTGLANHRTFHERLRSEADRARRRGRELSLVLMDLDHFKRVNDRHGHQTGDEVLISAARVLKAESRSGELVARVGGEEFAMLLPDSGEEDAYRAAERMRRAIAATSFPAVGAMTMSAGVCDLRSAGTPEDLYRLADSALYWAKHRGRDTVVMSSATSDR